MTDSSLCQIDRETENNASTIKEAWRITVYNLQRDVGREEKEAREVNAFSFETRLWWQRQEFWSPGCCQTTNWKMLKNASRVGYACRFFPKTNANLLQRPTLIHISKRRHFSQLTQETSCNAHLKQNMFLTVNTRSFQSENSANSEEINNFEN